MDIKFSETTTAQLQSILDKRKTDGLAKLTEAKTTGQLSKAQFDEAKASLEAQTLEIMVKDTVKNALIQLKAAELKAQKESELKTEINDYSDGL